MIGSNLVAGDDYWRTEWMFKLLDYEHYRVFHRDIELGLVVVNHEDQSVSYSWFDDVDRANVPHLPRSYRAARAWIRKHERLLP